MQHSRVEECQCNDGNFKSIMQQWKREIATMNGLWNATEDKQRIYAMTKLVRNYRCNCSILAVLLNAT